MFAEPAIYPVDIFCLNSVIICTLTSFAALVPELRLLIFLSIHSPCEDTRFLQAASSSQDLELIYLSPNSCVLRKFLKVF